ncbi:hypothetical protein Tco_1549742, partial [Tanacetum coccineum]
KFWVSDITISTCQCGCKRCTLGHSLERTHVEVEGHANDEEIKLAYGRLAKYYRPDGNDVAFVIYDGSGSVAKEKNARVGRLLAGNKIQACLQPITSSYVVLNEDYPR